MGIDALPQLHTRYGTNCHQKSETVKHLTILKVSKNLLIYSVGRCVIPCAFFGKSVKHIFSGRKIYPV